ncbi:MAG: hypothetical protein JXQ30_15640 [Spirochaetes bacterium]|nr:hypothetical protein [Spirochaetota bacterium]
MDRIVARYETDEGDLFVDKQKAEALSCVLCGLLETRAKTALKPAFWQDPSFTVNGMHVIPPANDDDTVQFLLIAVSQFFSYWYKDGEEETARVQQEEVRHEKVKNWGIGTPGEPDFIDDTIAAAYCLSRAWNSGMDLLDAQRLKSVSDEDIRLIYGDEKSGETLIPMQEERKKKLVEIGNGLVAFGRDNKRGQHFTGMLEAARGSIGTLLGLLVRYFPFSYGDPFLKLGLLLVKFLWDRLPEQEHQTGFVCSARYESLARFEDTYRFEAMADYMLPLFFFRTGVFGIRDPVLLDSLVQNREIRPDGEVENRFRALTIGAVRILADRTAARLGIDDGRGTYRGGLRFLIDSLFWQNALYNCKEHTYDGSVGDRCPYADICDACRDARLMLAGFPLVRTRCY